MNNKLCHRLRWSGVNLCRLLLSATFVFSGFVKGVDPRGMQYKLDDYLAAFGWSRWMPDGLTLPLAVLLGATEFCLGVFLFFGIRRRFTTSALLVLMALFTPLSLYLWVADPVADCGCFGDVLTLTNGMTLVKNLLLLGAAWVVARYRRHLTRFISERNQWMISMYSLLFIFLLSGYCLYRLPVLDFRPYHIGADLRSEMGWGTGGPRFETTFVLEKDGERRTFTADDYPDSTWTFVEARTERIGGPASGKEPDLALFLRPGEEDITFDVLTDKGYTFLLVAPRLETADDSRIDRINALYDYCVEQGYPFYCLTASDDEAVLRWQDLTGAEYPFCTSDETVLKTVIRANPGLILLKDGVVVNKWSAVELPVEDELTEPLDRLPMARLQVDAYSTRIARLLLWYLLPLLLCTFADRIWVGGKLYRRTKHKKEILTRLKRKEHEKENRGR